MKPVSEFRSRLGKVATAVVLVLVAPATGSAADRPGQTYSGLQNRPVKALSDTEISDLRQGKGMGMALAAELNGYPGPRHVLDSADRIGLSQEQVARTRQLFAEMKAGAEFLGRRIIELETDLDRRFRDSVIDRSALSALTQEIGTTRGRLRAHHLEYHLRMTQLMTPDQIASYNRLRGYSRTPMHDGTGHPGHGSHSGHGSR